VSDALPDGDDEHPAAGFDELVHQPNRLAILVVLGEARRADFSYLKRVLSLTDGNLGRHLAVLEAAGLIEIHKGFEGKRPRTWATITRQGRARLKDELAAMRALLHRFDG
jgi:DNA-binding MarR family transcriptional regulator